MGKAGGLLRTRSSDNTDIRKDEKQERIEIWEAIFSRWNNAGLIFAGIVCALLFILNFIY
jgi:hypothetical protein